MYRRILFYLFIFISNFIFASELTRGHFVIDGVKNKNCFDHFNEEVGRKLDLKRHKLCNDLPIEVRKAWFTSQSIMYGVDYCYYKVSYDCIKKVF